MRLVVSVFPSRYLNGRVELEYETMSSLPDRKDCVDLAKLRRNKL